MRASHSDSRLVLIVGEDPVALDRAGIATAADLGWRTIDLNVELAERLIGLSPSERRDEAWDALDEVVSRPEPGVVIVGTDILFEPALGYRPYEALRRLGRRGPMVATWLGVVEDQDVVRSSPGHPEYCRVRLDVPFLQADAKGGVS